MEALRNMELTVAEEELCQVVHCCRWMEHSIRDFPQRSKPLVKALEVAKKLKGKRKMRGLTGIAL